MFSVFFWDWNMFSVQFFPKSSILRWSSSLGACPLNVPSLSRQSHLSVWAHPLSSCVLFCRKSVVTLPAQRLSYHPVPTNPCHLGDSRQMFLSSNPQHAAWPAQYLTSPHVSSDNDVIAAKSHVTCCYPLFPMVLPPSPLLPSLGFGHGNLISVPFQ